jgi:hopene-associated glycosyltransferase HpnB
VLYPARDRGRARLGSVSSPYFAAAAALSAIVWLYLLIGHGRFWLADQRLPASADSTPPSAARSPDGAWPLVIAVVPARDEADVLPLTLPALLRQDYPGEFRIILIDDASSDGTAQVAEKLVDELAAEPGVAAGRLRVIRSDGPPPGWAGKVAAMNRGFEALDEDLPEIPEYVLFTDSDIAHPPDSVRRLVAFAESRRLGLVSLMALLRTETAAERAIVPAFVYSFAQLYPFARVNRPGGRTAAAAGGCMLVRRNALIEAGGLSRIAGARIDDVALGRLLKRGAAGSGQTQATPAKAVTAAATSTATATAGRIWLGLTTSVRSVRPYPSLADLWDMIARSAYTQLRRSPLLLLGTLLGLLLMYAIPPVLGLVFLPVALDRGGPAAVTCACGLTAWALMCASYLPTLRLYRQPAWRTLLLAPVMMVYGAMTLDSARRHYQGRGGSWKGRVEEG